MNAPTPQTRPTAQPAPVAAPFKLSFSRGTIVEAPRIVIHGAPGIGKSTLAASAPSPVFIDLEHGTLQLDVARADGIETWEHLLAAVHALATQPHDFKTLVIDTLDRAEWMCWQHLCAKARVANIEAVGKYGRGYTAAYEEFRGLARALDVLRIKRGMSIILIAHSKIENAPNAAGDEYQRWTLKVHKQVAGIFYEGFDAILFARLETFTSKSESGKVKGIGDRRVLETQESPAWLAKNRYRLPAQMNLSWDDLNEGLSRGAPEVAASIRAEIDAALTRLDALDHAAAETARAQCRDVSEPARLSVLLGRINAGIAQREAAAPDGSSGNA